MKKIILISLSVLTLLGATSQNLQAQQEHSTYPDGDSLAALVKMNYVYTLEDAIKRAKETHKPIFFNCFADWARPCHGMNGKVFSDQKFCDWMDKNFVNLFIPVDKASNRHIARRYHVTTFAHYLILDENGEVIHRIVGGAELPEFQERVALALSPKTSLRGTREAYNRGERSKKVLLNYLTALYLAEEDSLFNAIAPTYTSQLQPKDYAQKENWMFARKNVNSINDPLFKYMVENRALFDKGVGSDNVHNLIAQLYASEIFSFITGERQYNDEEMLNIYLGMQKAQLPQDDSCFEVYDIVKKHGQRNYDEALAALRNLKDQQTRYMLDMTLKFPEATPQQSEKLLQYYGEREKEFAAVGSSMARAYRDLIDSRSKPQAAETGIAFSTGSFDELKQKANAEGKLLFIDGFTTWCGPCKMLAKRTFPQPEVGEYMNPRFVSAQIDMERGEGPELAKRFNVSAFPTMLILKADGTLVDKIVGFYAPDQFIEKVKAIVEK